MLMQHMKTIVALLFAAATALADEPPWSIVTIDTNLANVVEGQPATLRLIVPVQNCTLGCLPSEVPLHPGDVVTWSFGDGSPDVTVTGSPRVMHTFPRGWFDVTARVGSRVFRQSIFSEAVAVSPPSYIDIVSRPSDVSESAGTYVVKLVRSGNLGVSSIMGFTAVQPADFWSPGSNLEHSLTTTTGTVTFAPGETSKDIALGLLNDTWYEGSRHTGVIIWSADGALIRPYPSASWTSAQTTVWFWIHDDDVPPKISVADVTVIEGNERGSEAVFNVMLSAPMGRGWTLSYYLENLTAMAGTDFIRSKNSSISLVIPAGANAVPVRVPIVEDHDAEPDETFAFHIIRPVAGPPEGNRLDATATIVNDDTTLTPAFLRVVRGTRGSLSFDIGNPASANRTVVLASSSPEILGVPSTVPLPVGSARVSVPFDALLPGQAYVEARVETAEGIVSAQARIEVVEATTLRVDPASLVFRQGDVQSIRIAFVPPVGEPHVVTLAAAGSAAISFPSTVVIPAEGTAEVALHATSPGTGTITVSAPSLLVAATILVEVLDAAAPAIDSVTPRLGAGGTRVTITGSRFGDQCSVTFGDLPAGVVARTASSLIVIAPPNAPGAVDVTVTCGALHATKTRAFTYATARRRPSR